MIGRLPTSLTVSGSVLDIRTDFRDILVIMQAFNDPELYLDEQYEVMLTILYGDLNCIPPDAFPEAIKQALWFLDCGQQEEDKKSAVKVMDWEQDEAIIFPAVNKVAGCEVRGKEYVHWWTFMGYFMEIEEGTFSTVLGIRQKRAKGKKLEKWEQEFYRNNKRQCDLKRKHTKEEQAEIDYWNRLLG
ncbi:Gp15 family bacteriophage protein [Enterocloster alcoholdehydrogenati]|uniref:Gp15 family bacteriophage protein n=1 Tax=Enterocloster alcoholdehydrogenati TaxID=2547410 RepID=UPI0015941ACD|nr:Gp15 family bacteriophage protein [Enterocloster alcoholdehydrogenati]